jgi:adenylate cyclase
MARVASAVAGAFGAAFIHPGDTELELAERYERASRELGSDTAAMLDHVFKMHQRQQVRQAVLGRAALAEGRIQGARPIAVCFADLVGFTRLGERVPAYELGAIAGRLGDLAAEVAAEPVRLVKMIGDAAMLVSLEAPPLVDAALALIELADAQGEDFPQLRAGIGAGEALGRSGDWYGRPVNLASRVCDVARPGAALTTEEVRERAPHGFRWSFAGRPRLKGVRDGVALYRVRRAELD